MATFCVIVFCMISFLANQLGCIGRLVTAGVGTFALLLCLSVIINTGIHFGAIEPPPPKKPTPYDNAKINFEAYEAVTLNHTKEEIDKLVGAPGQLISGELTGYGLWVWYNDEIPDDGWFCKRSVKDQPNGYPNILRVSFIDGVPHTKTLGWHWEDLSK